MSANSVPLGTGIVPPESVGITKSLAVKISSGPLWVLLSVLLTHVQSFCNESSRVVFFNLRDGGRVVLGRKGEKGKGRVVAEVHVS